MHRANNSVDGVIRRLKAKTVVNPVTGCWVWRGARNFGGYGQIYWRGRLWMIPRLAAYLTLGMEVNDWREAMHKCDNPPCWRWSHLAVGGHDENMKDCYSKGRR